MLPTYTVHPEFTDAKFLRSNCTNGNIIACDAPKNATDKGKEASTKGNEDGKNVQRKLQTQAEQQLVEALSIVNKGLV
jgi:hypothetical protein